MAHLFSYFYSKTLWFAQKVRTVFKHMVVNSGLIVVNDYITGWWFQTLIILRHAQLPPQGQCFGISQTNNPEPQMLNHKTLNP